jgi:hypothetical protein
MIVEQTCWTGRFRTALRSSSRVGSGNVQRAGVGVRKCPALRGIFPISSGRSQPCCRRTGGRDSWPITIRVRLEPHVVRACIRHCVECPYCQTRYLLGFSPYSNGSYLLPVGNNLPEEWSLYCACGARPSRWHWSDLKKYTVSGQAHDRGYGARTRSSGIAGTICMAGTRA